jgi:hypothetical protein
MVYTQRQNPVERWHRTIDATMKKLVDNHSGWSEYVGYITFRHLQFIVVLASPRICCILGESYLTVWICF